MSQPPLNFSFPLIDERGYASDSFRTWILGLTTTSGAGTVTSVSGTGTVNGITLTGTVTSSGNLTLGGSLSGVSLSTQVTGTLPVANGGTGLTTLTANNVVLGNGTSTPSFVAPSTSGNVLTSNGTTWVSAAPVDVQEFLSNGTWTKPSRGTMVFVEMWAGGGSGGNNTASATNRGGASGGEYVCGWFPIGDCGATESVTVGAGGAAIANGVLSDGNVGGDSSFGSLLTAIGGNPGSITQNNSFVTIPRSPDDVLTNSATLRTLIFPQAGYGAPEYGGNTVYGGAGGGGTNSPGTGGVSSYGGNGGNGNNTAGVPAGDGSFPGGGGGSSGNDGGSGAGGDGFVRVIVW